MTNETFKLLVLALPGIICFFLSQKVIGKSKRTATNTILLVFLYSMLSYLLLSIFHSIYNCIFNGKFESDVISNFLSPDKDISVLILFFTSLSGLVLAYLLSYLNHFNIANRFGQKINATKRFGDEDVWHYFHNSAIGPQNDWFMVRDLKADLSYYCNITVWSDSGGVRELILHDVSVYTNSTAEHMYDAQDLYVCRNRDDIMIEIPPPNAETIEEYRIKTNEPKEVKSE